MTDDLVWQQYPIDPDELPSSWSIASVGDVAKAIQPGFPSGAHNSEGRGVPHLRPMNVSRVGTIDLHEMRYVERADGARLVRHDVLFNNTNSAELVGKTAAFDLPGDWALSNHMTRICLPEAINHRFVANQLHYLWMTGYFRALCVNHVNQASVSSTTLARAVPLVIAPIAEQLRIVEAIDAAFSKLDAGVTYLNAAEQRLNVLERQIREGILAGPWEWTTLDSLLSGIEAGKSFKTSGTPADSDEWGVVKVSAMTYGSFRPAENKALPLGTSINPAWVIRKGDVLLSRANTSDYVGATVLVDVDPGRLILSDKSLRLVPKLDVDARWLQLALAAPGTRSQISAAATGVKDSMRNISQQKLKSIRLPRPTLEDQLRVVATAEQQLAGLSNLGSELRRCVQRSLALRRTVFRSAFSGRLVMQDPADESAEKLLEHLAAVERLVGRGRRASNIGVSV